MAINLSTAGIKLKYAVEATAGTRPTSGYKAISGAKSTLALGFVSFFILLIKDLSDEYQWKFKLLNSKNGVVSFASVVFLICYILLFGVLNGGSFIYFQF